MAKKPKPTPIEVLTTEVRAMNKRLKGVEDFIQGREKGVDLPSPIVELRGIVSPITGAYINTPREGGVYWSPWCKSECRWAGRIEQWQIDLLNMGLLFKDEGSRNRYVLHRQAVQMLQGEAARFGDVPSWDDYGVTKFYFTSYASKTYRIACCMYDGKSRAVGGVCFKTKEQILAVQGKLIREGVLKFLFYPNENCKQMTMGGR